MADVLHLFDDIQLAEAVVALGVVGNRVELALVAAVDILDIAQPVVDEAQLAVLHGGAHAAAAVMPDDHDVLDFQHFHGVLQDRQAVEIAVQDQVGDIAVHEDFAGIEADDLVGGHARIGAADPQIVRVLLGGQAAEIARLVLGLALDPAVVVLEQAGAKVAGMVAIFTYGFETAEKNFSNENVDLVCLSDFPHLLVEALQKKFITEEELIYVKAWRLDPANWK